MAKSDGKMRRSLGLADMFFLGIGAIIGSGWLFAAQKGANAAGSYALVSWVIGAILIILIGLVYAELGAAMPRAGGFVRYPSFTHGSFVGFVIGFFCLIAYSAVASTEVEAVRGYAQFWWPILENANGGPTTIGFLMQLALLVVFFLLNYWSVNIFGKTNTVITILKFIVPGLIIIFMLMHLNFSNFSVGGGSPGGIKGIFAAVTGSGIAYSFNGFRMPVEFAGESRHPQKDVPTAIVLSVVVGLFIYLLLQVAFIGSIPSGLLSGGWANVHFDSPWAGLASVIGMAWLANLVILDSLISPSETGNIYLSATARSLFAWAQNGTFYKIFGKIGKHASVPRPALWLALVMAVLWMSPARFQNWGGIIGAATAAKAFTYLVGPVSLIALRRTVPDMERPFLLKGATTIAALAFIAASFIIYWSGWKVVSLLVPLIIPVIIAYFAFVDKNPRFEGKVGGDMFSGYWLIGDFIFLFIMSLVGSYGPNGMHWIPAPWDTIVTGVGSLAFYWWGIVTALKEPRMEENKD